MKKLFFAFFMVFLIPIIYWYLVGYIEFGEDIIHMHFDLYETLQPLLEYEINFSSINVFEIFDNIILSLNFPDWASWLGELISASVTPLLFIYNLIKLFIDFLIIALQFFTNPVFY